MSDSSEVWLPTRIDGYEVSSLGAVRSKPRLDSYGRRVRGCILKPTLRNGYYEVSPSIDGVAELVRVHVLVLETFKGPKPEPLMVARHYDDNRLNNRIENLSWGTHSENAYDKVRNGKHPATLKANCPRGHSLSSSNLVPSQLSRGRRSCLSCARADSYMLRHPELDMQVESDRYYRQLTGIKVSP